MSKPFFGHTIRDDVHDELTAAFGRHHPSQAEAHEKRLALLAISNGRKLTDAELATLKACDTAFNLHNAAKYLGDRKPEDIFGAGATLCQVHGMSHTLDCGCVLSHIFDHHRRHEPDLVTHAHPAHNVCDAHADHYAAHGWESHHHHALAEHKAKHDDSHS